MDQSQSYHDFELPEKSVIEQMSDQQYQQYKECLSIFIEGHNQAHQALEELSSILEEVKG